MSETKEEKSQGRKFAEQQLLRYGWEQGKGLGRDENGMTEAIKVKVKCDKGGIGHSQGEQFTFHWWDHVFNKASAGLTVESGQDGVIMKKVAGEENDNGMISNKKPRQAKLSKAMHYGCFVKSATLFPAQPEQKSSSSDDSSGSDDDDQKLDLSSTTKLSDADLVRACGGRTAHKGARHGLTMSAKLLRLEQQEQEFMAKYGKKSQDSPSVITTGGPVGSQAAEMHPSERLQRERAERKDRARKPPEHAANEEQPSLMPPENNDAGGKKSKRKRCLKELSSLASEEALGFSVPVNDSNAIMSESETKKKKKKKKRKKQKRVGEAEDPSPCPETNGKQSKTSSKHPEEAPIDEKPVNPELGGENTHKKTKLRKRDRDGEGAENGLVEDPAPKKKKKKKKKTSRDSAHE